MDVTADDLVRGMWLAVESCGEGLQAASDLLRGSRYARSVALAMAARDELGKARLLRNLWEEAQSGRVITLDEVLAICGQHVKAKGLQPVGHVAKQKAAQVLVSLEGGPGDPLRVPRRMRAIQEVSVLRDAGAAVDDPALVAAYSEWDAAEAEINTEVQARAQRVPAERHALRNRGLYLDVAVEQGTVSWKRPNEIGVGEAKRALRDAVNDYWRVRENLQPPFVEHAHGRALAATLTAWPDKPDLPQL